MCTESWNVNEPDDESQPLQKAPSNSQVPELMPVQASIYQLKPFPARCGWNPCANSRVQQNFNCGLRKITDRAIKLAFTFIRQSKKPEARTGWKFN